MGVRTWGLAKSYGGRPALRGLDLEVPAGQIFGLLGPNGAGKSTTIALLSTLVRPSGGRARVAGHDVVADDLRVRRRIGMVFQDTTVEPDLTAAENLMLHAALYAMPTPHARRRARELLEFVGLTGYADALVRTFSGGMRRRLEVARAIMHRPRVLFLDEPTSGLDPTTRARLWQHLRHLRRERAMTVFITTHYLEEAEYCDRIVILNDGRVVADGTPAALKAEMGCDRIELSTPDPAATARQLRERLGLPLVLLENDVVRVRARDGAALLPRLCAAVEGPIHGLILTRPSLDDVFLHHTGRAPHDSAAP
jgi:ABC-2 type transport system ATP-binding protein